MGKRDARPIGPLVMEDVGPLAFETLSLGDQAEWKYWNFAMKQDLEDACRASLGGMYEAVRLVDGHPVDMLRATPRT